MREESFIEAESLKDLERIVSEAGEWGIKLVLIGGYAVRAYTRGYRYTKDMDFVAEKLTGELNGFLKTLGYGVEEKKSILAGRRKLNGGFIDLHISVGEVFDVSTGKRYPITDQTLKESRVLEVSGYHEDSREIKVKAPAVSLESLVILKLMTKGREKDWVDLISLFTDQWSSLNLRKVCGNCSEAGLSRHIRDQALHLVGILRTGGARKTWLSWTGQRLTGKKETELIKHLKQLADSLK